MNFLPAGDPLAGPAGAATVGIRPQHLRLADPAAPGAIAAEVRLVEALGTETVLHAATTAPASASSPSSPARPRSPPAPA